MRTKSLLAAIAVGVGLVSAPVLTSPAVSAAPAPTTAQTLHTLDTLAVKGRAPKTGYDRDLFGQAWSDDVNVDGGHNGCDTRNDILNRDLTNKTYKAGTRDCVVLTGTLNDAYTGKTIQFVRGTSTSSKVQIDHVVALSDAWQKGAQQLTSEQRQAFANDPLNLRAVDGPANMQKRDGDAATWLPSNKSFRCTYVTTQVEVKAKYNLWVTSAEKSAIQRVLSDCSSTQAPAPKATPRQSTPKPAPRQQAPVAPSGAYYKNCSAARAAGAAPLYRGQPGYRSALDRDNDGVACE
ncbi:GmrSD restriction endonuclease domain-containing protein [Gordonia sp. (in: high G+C Gram-positive bacteria)]|uniref:GmrSD restriction endonuclease domain-containing protein n=1 Tax=Gordonia sp. (in: high G+C Gram-positive bacteria) TaxID=84139 RepID=UPI003F9887F1